MTESTRRLERERVLELLYESEIKNIPIDELLADLPVEPEPFVKSLVLGVSQSGDELNQQIEQRATNWDLGRIAVIDRLVLQIALWEIANRPETPLAVIISEAVSLAKTFSTEASGRFVNGILGTFEDDR